MKNSATEQQDSQRLAQSHAIINEIQTGAMLAERYQVVKKKSHNWNRESWICVDRETQELVVAIHHHELSENSLQRLQNDIHRTLSIKSDRLAKIYATETTGDSTWVVLEEVRGENLLRLSQNRIFSLQEIVEVFKELLLAVCEMHSAKVIDLSLSSDTIFLFKENESYRCRLMWAGRSEYNKSSECLTDYDLGNLFTISPESLGLTNEPVGPTSDIYSIGCLLYKLIAGRYPFEADNLNDLLFMQTTQSPPTLRELGKCQSRFLDEIIQRCLQFYSCDRYQSVEAILFDVESLQSSLVVGVREPELTIGTQDVRSTLTNSTFCAREDEILAFLAALERSEKASVQDIVLSGESGVGKSRLLQEFKDLALGRGASIFKGVATTDLGSPFQILESISQQIAAKGKQAPNLAERIRTECKEYAELIVNALPELRELFRMQTELLVPHSVGEASTLRALCCLLESLGSDDARAVVIFDDCQWDIEFITRLMKMWRVHQAENNSGRQNTMLLCSFRSREVSAKHPIRSLKHIRQIALEPISNEKIGLILQSMAGRLPEIALEMIQELADGSPFMASAILHGLVESQGLVPTENGWEIDEEKFNQVSSSAKAGEILAQRLNSLSQSTRRVLEVGAILGTVFELKILASIVDLSRQKFEAALEDARKRRFLWSRRGESSCQFLHDKIREELLDKLDADHRTQLHSQIAGEIQRRYPTRVAELAYHYESAGDFEQAYRFSTEAAHSALKKHALKVAKQQYEIALRTVPETPATNVFSVQEGFGEVLMLLGKYQQAEAVFEEAALSAQTDIERAEIRGKQGELSIKRGDMNSAIVQFEKALRIMSQHTPQNGFSLAIKLTREACLQVFHTLFPGLFCGRLHREATSAEKLTLRLLSGFSHASWYCRSKPLTLWAHLRGMNKGELFRPSTELAQAYSDHAPAMILIPIYSRAYRYAVKSLEIRNKLEHVWGQGQSLHFKGIMHYANCDYENCIDDCRKAIKILERTGDYWQVHIARYQLAAALFRLGRYDEASVECRRNYESGIVLGDHQATGIILDIWVQVSQDQISPEMLNSERLREREDVQGKSQVILANAIFCLKSKKTEEAIQLLLNAKQNIQAAGVQNTYTSPIYYWLVVAYRQSASEDESVSQLKRRTALRNAWNAARAAMLVSMRFRNELPRLYRELAYLSAMDGKQDKAKRYLTKSISIAEKHGARIEHAHSLLAFQEIAEEMGWSVDARMKESFSIAQIQLEILKFNSVPTVNRDSISLADQFETLMHVGRKIMSARDVDEITCQAVEAARRLLRAPQASIDWVGRNQESVHQEHLEQRPRKNETTAKEPDRITTNITIRADVVAKLIVEHEGLSRTFNEIDHQIAEFISSLIGAALENAEGFLELKRLNENLEVRVAERTEELKDRNDQLLRSNRELETVAKALRRTQTRLVDSIRTARLASESKGRFLAMMSHEIRTPMNGIIGMAQLALESCRDSQQESHLNVVVQSSRTLLTILNDVLDFSKIEAGKLTIESISFNLHESVIDACRLLAIKAEEKKLMYRCLISPDVPVQVMGDPNRIRQVLLNLIGNAIKFTSDGNIDIVVECRQTNHFAPEIHFSVIDSGIGIAEVDLEKIFVAFDQGDATVTRRFGGTGLGLAISRELVNLMGGELRIQSKIGVGSTFSFGLELPECVDVYEEEFAQRSLLLFSDDEVHSSHLEKCLLSSGHRVTTVNSLESLEILVPDPESSGFDSMIVDLNEIEQADDELLEAAIDRVPLIYLVPSSTGSAPSKQLRMNQCTSIMKPFPFIELQNAIKKTRTLGSAISENEKEWSQFESQNRSLKLLVVDDSEINLMVAKSMIESAGHRITTVPSGQDAIDCLQANSYDAIFMDIEMPTIDGITATRLIRELEEREQRARTPIYAMTAHVLEEFKVKCKDAGMNGFISKPIDQEELIDFLDELTVTVFLK